MPLLVMLGPVSTQSGVYMIGRLPDIAVIEREGCAEHWETVPTGVLDGYQKLARGHLLCGVCGYHLYGYKPTSHSSRI